MKGKKVRHREYVFGLIWRSNNQKSSQTDTLRKAVGKGMCVCVCVVGWDEIGALKERRAGECKNRIWLESARVCVCVFGQTGAKQQQQQPQPPKQAWRETLCLTLTQHINHFQTDGLALSRMVGFASSEMNSQLNQATQ